MNVASDNWTRTSYLLNTMATACT